MKDSNPKLDGTGMAYCSDGCAGVEGADCHGVKGEPCMVWTRDALSEEVARRERRDRIRARIVAYGGKVDSL